MVLTLPQMASESISELEIPIWVKGTQKWVTGLTKRTTCDDVIYALLYQDGKHDQVNTSAYAIFEKWREVERPLQGRTKIVKVWRAWGAEQGNVHLSMRKIDELEYSGEFSLTRRKKRSRHRTRDRDRERERDRDRERDRHGREHRRHHAYCQNTSERLRSMESVVKLVISQERKLKDVIEHIDDTDKLIGKYESRLHDQRLKQNGDEYVTDSYLDSRSTDSMDDFFERVNIEELEMYVDYCDRIIALEDRIAEEHAKIEELSFQIQQGIQNSGDERLKSAGDELTSVQVELNRAVTCAIMQQYKCQDLQRELQFYDEKLKSRNELCQRLEQELNECEGSVDGVSEESFDNNGANVDIPDRVHSRSASVDRLERDSSVERAARNPLPVPDRPANRTKYSDSTSKPPPIPERKPPLPPERPPRKNSPINQSVNNPDINQSNQVTKDPVPGRKPILKQSSYDFYKNGYTEPPKPSSNGETKVRFKTDSSLVDKYYWEESSSEGISIDQSDCSDSKDLFECGVKKEKDNYALYKPGVADKPYLTVKVEDNDSNSDTGLSSMHSDDSAVYHLETLV